MSFGNLEKVENYPEEPESKSKVIRNSESSKIISKQDSSMHGKSPRKSELKGAKKKRETPPEAKDNDIGGWDIVGTSNAEMDAFLHRGSPKQEFGGFTSNSNGPEPGPDEAFDTYKEDPDLDIE